MEYNGYNMIQSTQHTHTDANNVSKQMVTTETIQINIYHHITEPSQVLI